MERSCDYASLRLHHRFRLDDQHPHEAHDQHEFNKTAGQAFSASAPPPEAQADAQKAPETLKDQMRILIGPNWRNALPTEVKSGKDY